MSNTKSTTGFTFGNRTYDRLKFLVTIVLPALAALYITLASFWGFPKVEEVAGTITGIATFLGVALGISSKNYEPEDPPGDPVGDFVITDTPAGKSINLDLKKDPEEFIDGDTMTFVRRDGQLDSETEEVLRSEELE